MSSRIRQRFNALSIRWRGLLILVVPVVSVSAILTLMAHYSRNHSHRATAVRNLDAIIESNLRDAEQIIRLGERSASIGLTERLRAFPDIERMVLYDRAGTGGFVYRGRDQPVRAVPELGRERISFDGARLVMIRPLVSRADAFGFVRVDAHVEELERAQTEAVESALRAFVGMVVILGTLALFLHLLIIRPVVELSSFVATASRDGDYETRLAMSDRAELGALRDGIHEFLERIGAERERVNRLNQRLRSAKEIAEQASYEKGRFLARVSHELRTPLNGVIGVIELLRSGDLSEAENRHYLDTAQVSAQHLLHIINDTLDLSQIEHGKLQLQPERFRLRGLLTKLEQVMEVPMRDGQLAFTCTAHADVPDRLIGDSARLMQVLLNLVGNARKFTAPGGAVTVAVSVHGRGDASVVLRFAVEDSGAGIDADQRERIFDAYHQADREGANVGEGSGLGLAISGRLVALMGGDIGVDSEVGVGSVFWFQVPMGIWEPADREPGDVDEIRASQGAIAPMRILLVDDNRINRMVAERMLRTDGHEVVSCENGAQAVERIATEEFDFVLMDVHMPVMDGCAATRAIRERERGTGEHLPIVGVTASALSEDVERFLESGMDECLSKPVTLEAIRATLGGFGMKRQTS